MLNHETTGWGDFRSFNGRTFSLYHTPSYRECQEIDEYRVKIRKRAKEEGHTHVRIVMDTYGEYATYVYPTNEALEDRNEPMD